MKEDVNCETLSWDNSMFIDGYEVIQEIQFILGLHG
jgi:hypothetical protein